MRVQLDAILLQVGKKLVGAQHLRDLDQLVIVVVTLKEGVLAEDLWTE